MQLQTGKTYHAHQPAGELELDNETVEFPEVNFTFTVQPCSSSLPLFTAQGTVNRGREEEHG